MKTPKAKKHSFKIVALFVTLMLMMNTLSGCKTLPDDMDIKDPGVKTATTTEHKIVEPASNNFTLSYNSTDVTNPFTLVTDINSQLTSLLYNGLVRLDETLTPVLDLASDIKKGENSFAVTINSDAKFSDGSPVLASDVVASFGEAKKSDYYKRLLESVSSVKASGDNRSLKVSVSSFEPNEWGIFTFPIIKEGKGDFPVGAGRYMFVSGDKPMLKVNPHKAGFEPKITEIGLAALADENAILFALASGLISFTVDDLSKGEIVHTGVPSNNLSLNSMVFLGINTSKKPFNKEIIRNSISHGIDRQKVCESAFAGRALPATLPFHSKWSVSSKTDGFSPKENIALAVAQLEKEGYNTESMLKFELLVPKENSFRVTAAEDISKQLIKCAVDIKVVPLPFEEYEERVKKGNYDFYLGEVRMPDSMSLSPFFSQNGGARYGVSLNGEAAKKYKEYVSGKADIGKFAETFVKDTPFIPVAYREGQVTFIRNVTGISKPGFDPFYEFENWEFNLS